MFFVHCAITLNNLTGKPARSATDEVLHCTDLLSVSPALPCKLSLLQKCFGKSTRCLWRDAPFESGILGESSVANFSC